MDIFWQWWEERSSLQRTWLGAVFATFVTLLLAVSVLISLKQANYKELVAARDFPDEQINRIEEFLAKKNFSYQQSRNGDIYVSKDQWVTTREALNNEGLLNAKPEGLDLFDNQLTWLKGKEEIRILEQRALKGQLEREISRFDKINSASVMLDRAAEKSPSQNPYQAKASVILELKPGATLDAGDVEAILSHLLATYRQINPSRVAISDTTGRLYKAFGNEQRSEGQAELMVEEEIQTKVENILEPLVSSDRANATVSYQVEDGEKRLAVSVMIDKTLPSAKTIKETVEQQLKLLLSSYASKNRILVQLVPFYELPKVVGPMPAAASQEGAMARSEVLSLAAIAAFFGLVSGWAISLRFNRESQRRTPSLPFPKSSQKVNVIDEAKSIVSHISRDLVMKNLSTERWDAAAQLLCILERERSLEYFMELETAAQVKVIKALVKGGTRPWGPKLRPIERATVLVFHSLKQEELLSSLRGSDEEIAVILEKRLWAKKALKNTPDGEIPDEASENFTQE